MIDVLVRCPVPGCDGEVSCVIEHVMDALQGTCDWSCSEGHILSPSAEEEAFGLAIEKYYEPRS